MTQSERRLFLIQYLKAESSRYRELEIPRTAAEQFWLYRSLVNVRPPQPISEEYLRVEDAFLQEETRRKGITSVEDLTPLQPDIYLWQGDITALAADGIVNAANSDMLGCFYLCHSCIDNCIHTFAGVRLRLKCLEIMNAQTYDKEPTGLAKITPAYNLPSRYVLHTVGPIYGTVQESEAAELLKSCYTECLRLANEYELDSLAFCCISTGEFRFPNEAAAQIAVDTVKDYKAQTGSSIKVIFNVFKDKDREIYEQLLR